MSYARHLAARVAPLSAWNPTADEQAATLRATRNGVGLLLLFIDGSRALIRKGAAVIEVRPDRIDVRERYRRNQFHALPGLSDYLSCGLQDLQYSENDEACQDEREARDVGTIYDLDSFTFERLRDDYRDFIAAAGEDFTDWRHEYGAALFGSDFHLSRSGHGAGFFDRGAGDLGDRLQALAEKAGNVDWGFDDDGKVYA